MGNHASALHSAKVLSIVGALVGVQAQNVTNGNFTFISSYALDPNNITAGLPPNCDAEDANLGGGSIVNDTLYIIICAESSDATFLEVPLERDGKCGSYHKSRVSYIANP